MSISAENNQSWLEQHSSIDFVGKELDWLNEQRRRALQHFEETGLPGIRDEQWRYTNLRAIKSAVYSLPIKSEAPRELPVELATSNNSRLVFIDGLFSKNHSNLSALSNEITFTTLESTLNDAPELIEDYFGSALPTEQHGFTALNSAYCQDGYVLILPKNYACKEVLEVIFVASNSDNQISHCRNLIIAEANSECTIIERHIGSDGSVYLNNTVTEIFANENANIDHAKLQQESSEGFHIGGIFIQQAANAQVKNHNIELSGLVIRNDICADLNSPGAHIEMNGLVMGNDRQHIDNHTQVNHRVPHCTSDEHYKAVLDDKSRSVFRGRIVVAQDAQQTNADQQNNNLLLSKGAEADTLPQLEIYADDVKCSHGATVGQLDPKSLFYLRSRGINLQSAISLLTIGFANEVIDRINVDALRDELKAHIADQFLSSDTNIGK